MSHRAVINGDMTQRPIGGRRVQVTLGYCYQCGQKWPCQTELTAQLAALQRDHSALLAGGMMPPYAFHDLGIALSKTCLALMTVAGWSDHEEDPYVRKTLDEADAARAKAKLDIASVSVEIERLEAELFPVGVTGA